MEERVETLQTFLKWVIPEHEQQKINAIVEPAIPGFEKDRSLSFAENLDKMYAELGLDPIRRKFWVDLFCGLTPEIQNEEALRHEIPFYSKFRHFDSSRRLENPL